MMNNDELKNRIVDTLNATEISTELLKSDIDKFADALTAEVVRDIVKIAREIGVSATAMAVFEAEKAKYHAEVAEKAGRIIQRDMTRVFDISNPRVCELIANIWDLAKKQAEKELAEDKRE